MRKRTKTLDQHLVDIMNEIETSRRLYGRHFAKYPMTVGDECLKSLQRIEQSVIEAFGEAKRSGHGEKNEQAFF